MSAPNNLKSSETKIAGIIPLWQLKEKIPFFVLSAVLVIITYYIPDTELYTGPFLCETASSYSPSGQCACCICDLSGENIYAE